MHGRRYLLLALSIGLLTGVVIVTGQDQPRLPAPSEDRVGFPEGYQEEFTLLFTVDRPDNNSVRPIYGNAAAASAEPGGDYPYGSVLVMESFRALLDENENPVLDENGRFQRGELSGIFVQRKERGFGEAYQEVRSGEWEYVAYRPDGTHLVPPENTGNCAQCHLQQAEAARDFVFRAGLGFSQASGAVPNGIIEQYTFVPGNLEVEAGSTVTWYNDDEVFHTISGANFDSGIMPYGASFSLRFDEPGEFPFACSIHPAMTGTVVVAGGG